MDVCESFGDILLGVVDKYPNKIAIIEGGTRVTYKELLERVCRIQEQFSSVIKPNTVVGLFLPNSIDYIASYFAVSMRGAIVLPLYWQMSKVEIKHILNYTKADLLITNEEGLKKKPPKIQARVLEKEQYSINHSKVINNRVNNKPALLLQTSGTTSNPKIVAHSFKGILSNVRNHIDSLMLTDKDIVLITLPLPFGYCNTSQFLTHIALGGTIVLNSTLIHPKQLLNLIEKNSVSIFTVVPTILASFELLESIKFNDYDLSSLRIICFGGGSVSNKTILDLKSKFINVEFAQTYGQTEAGPRITTKLLSNDYEVTNVGKPLKDTEVLIKDEKGKILPKGNIGEICCKSPSIMEGYFKNIEATNMAIRDGYLHTGDIGYIDHNGDIHIKGRKDNMFKSNGLHVNPEEIEHFIKENFPIKNVMVKSYEHHLYGLVPIAFITTEQKKDLEILKEHIKKRCEERFSKHKVPKKIIISDNISATFTGKIKR